MDRAFIAYTPCICYILKV